MKSKLKEEQEITNTYRKRGISIPKCWAGTKKAKAEEEKSVREKSNGKRLRNCDKRCSPSQQTTPIMQRKPPIPEQTRRRRGRSLTCCCLNFPARSVLVVSQFLITRCGFTPKTKNKKKMWWRYHILVTWQAPPFCLWIRKFSFFLFFFSSHPMKFYFVSNLVYIFLKIYRIAYFHSNLLSYDDDTVFNDVRWINLNKYINNKK